MWIKETEGKEDSFGTSLLILPQAISCLPSFLCPCTAPSLPPSLPPDLTFLSFLFFLWFWVSNSGSLMLPGAQPPLLWAHGGRLTGELRCSFFLRLQGQAPQAHGGGPGFLIFAEFLDYPSVWASSQILSHPGDPLPSFSFSWCSIPVFGHWMLERLFLCCFPLHHHLRTLFKKIFKCVKT